MITLWPRYGSFEGWSASPTRSTAESPPPRILPASTIVSESLLLASPASGLPGAAWVAEFVPSSASLAPLPAEFLVISPPASPATVFSFVIDSSLAVSLLVRPIFALRPRLFSKFIFLSWEYHRSDPVAFLFPLAFLWQLRISCEQRCATQYPHVHLECLGRAPSPLKTIGFKRVSAVFPRQRSTSFPWQQEASNYFHRAPWQSAVHQLTFNQAAKVLSLHYDA